jgi:hypothetical protein
MVSIRRSRNTNSRFSFGGNGSTCPTGNATEEYDGTSWAAGSLSYSKNVQQEQVFKLQL